MAEKSAGSAANVAHVTLTRALALGSRQPSIKDIARLARVSHPTVSRALQNSPLVSAETAARIRKIAEEQGYRASAVARGLVTRRTRTVGLIVTSVDDPFASEVACGVEEVASDRGYAVLLANSHADPERERRVVQELAERRVDGLVVTSSRVGKAAELAMEKLSDGTNERVAALRNRLENGILQIEGTAVNGAGAPRVANTANIRFEQLEGEALLIALDLKGVAVSGGSACHSGSTEPSHVLMAMGLGKREARASLRFSLLRTATEEDVEQVLKVVPQAVEHLRALAPCSGD